MTDEMNSSLDLYNSNRQQTPPAWQLSDTFPDAEGCQIPPVTFHTLMEGRIVGLRNNLEVPL